MCFGGRVWSRLRRPGGVVDARRLSAAGQVEGAGGERRASGSSAGGAPAELWGACAGLAGLVAVAAAALAAGRRRRRPQQAGAEARPLRSDGESAASAAATGYGTIARGGV